MKRSLRNPKQQRHLRAKIDGIMRSAVDAGSISAADAALVLGGGGMRSAAAAAAIDDGPEPRHLSAPPDPYAPALLKLRAARGQTDMTRDELGDRLVAMETFRRSFFTLATTGRAAALDPVTSDLHRLPPDPYEAALRARREGRR